jgi:PAS domain S-box-containing protein
VAFFLYSGKLLVKAETLASYEYRSKSVIGHTNWIIILTSVATNGLIGYLITNKPFYLSVYKECIQEIPSALQGLHEAINEPGKVDLKEDSAFSVAVLAITQKLHDQISTASNNQGADGLKALDSEGFLNAWRQLYATRHELLQNERLFVKSGLEELPSTRAVLKVLIIVGVMLNIFGGVYLVYAYNQHIAKRLAVLNENSDRIARGETLLPASSGSDEIAALDNRFHQMADDLERGRKVLEDNERYLRALIQNLPVGVLTLADDGLISAVNGLIENLLGYKESELIGKNLSFLFPEFEPIADRSESSQETNTVRKDGVPIAVELKVTHYQFSEKTLALVAVQDITERRELEKLRQDFLNMVSHDLRSPLQGIKLAQQMLLRGSLGVLSDKAKQTIQMAERNSDRMLELINDLLDFEKMQSGEMQLEIAPEQLREIIDEAIEAVQTLAVAKRLALSWNACSLQVLADKRRIIQVLVNLLSNAIKFSPEDSTIQIETKESGDEVIVEIIDHGPGIAAENQPKIFEKFKQLSGVEYNQRGGTGLGLPICKAIVEFMGGRIGVNSALGEGSTFWFSLPKFAEPNKNVLSNA